MNETELVLEVTVNGAQMALNDEQMARWHSDGAQMTGDRGVPHLAAVGEGGDEGLGGEQRARDAEERREAAVARDDGGLLGTLLVANR